MLFHVTTALFYSSSFLQSAQFRSGVWKLILEKPLAVAEVGFYYRSDALPDFDAL